MDSYIPLLIVPLLCVPIQHLYLAAGQRYDLGAITYVATGTFLATFFTDPAARPQITLLIIILVLLSIAACLIRCFILAYGRPRDFTLFTFCQLWAVPAIVGYEIERQSSDGRSGIYIHTFYNLKLPVALVALVVALIITGILTRTSTTLRLVIFTESPRQYSLLFGSPLQLAWKIEAYALLSYLLGGLAFRFMISDISGDIFGTESIWCLLCAAVIPRKWQKVVVAGPVAVTFVRLFINQSNIDSKYSLLLVYFLLALCLAIVISNAKRASREIVG
jgi:hypothetical protein